MNLHTLGRVTLVRWWQYVAKTENLWSKQITFKAVGCCVSFRSDAIIGWAAKLLPQSLFVMYEQIHPHDPFGQIMQEHFQKLNSTLHALRQYADTAAQRHRFLDKVSTQPIHKTLPVSFHFFEQAQYLRPRYQLNKKKKHSRGIFKMSLFLLWRLNIWRLCLQGWEECVCLDMNNFLFGLVPEEERCRLESLEPFDEYEVSWVSALHLL